MIYSEFFSRLTLLISIMILSGTVSASAISLSSTNVAGPGDSATLHLTLDEAPNGLAGCFVNVSVDPGVARITDVKYPSWAVLHLTQGLNEGTDVRIKANDPKKMLQPGVKNVEIAAITIQGINTGSTTVHLHDMMIDNQKNEAMNPTLVDGSFSVGDSPSLMSQLSAIAPVANPETTPDINQPSTVSQAAPAVTPKGTYVPLEAFVPVFGVLISILIIGIGGQQKRG